MQMLKKFVLFTRVGSESCMPNEEVILSSDRVECIVNSLSQVLKVEEYFQFKLRFDKKTNRVQTLTIVPHTTPVEITLSRP
jgi:hypothetical protein